MNKPEYGDLYKFMVSLGLILIAFAILLPWLFLRESFDSLISASDIANLTPTAQTLITYRQNAALWFVQNIIWIAAAPAFLGVVSLLGGLFLWQRKQKLTDTKDELETEKLRLEVKNMLPQQIAVKLIQEATSESPSKQGERVEVKEQFKVIHEYVRIENMIFSKLSNCFGIDSVRTNQQVRDYGVDAIVRINEIERAIFEIKYLRKPAQLSQRIKDVTQALVRSIQSYTSLAPHLNAYGVGLIIFDNEHSPNDRITSTVINGIYIKIITIAEGTFTNLDCAELRSIVSNRPESK